MSFEESADLVRRATGLAEIDVALILGSGQGGLLRNLEDVQEVPYRRIPVLEGPSVAGHEGRLVTARFEGRRLLVFAGRRHLYQGYTAAEAAAPVELAAALGCPRVLICNAVGGIRAGYAPGDFCLIRDHINLSGENPLVGLNENIFVDLAGLYRSDFFEPLSAWGAARSVRLHCGVLAALKGPSYETPAEIRMLELLGADVVSMSMVPEAIMAARMRMEVVGLSMITNLAAGKSGETLKHEDVLHRGAESAENFSHLARALLGLWFDIPSR